MPSNQRLINLFVRSQTLSSASLIRPVKGQEIGIRPHTAPLRSPFVAMIDISALYPLVFGVFILAFVRRWKRPTLPYPPGPKGYPILGNVLDLTTSVPLQEDITSLADRYGMF